MTYYDESGFHNRPKYVGASKSLAKEILKLDKFTELNDPLRKSQQVITEHDIADMKLDTYLFGKDRDIND